MPFRFIITDHAVAQFQARVVPELSFAQADSLLRRRAPKAKPAGERSRSGQTYWRMTAPDCLLVTKADSNQTVVVTVVGPEKLPECDEDEAAVVEAYQRSQAIRVATGQIEAVRNTYQQKLDRARREYRDAVGVILRECTADVRERLERSGVAGTGEETP